jgi:hypothetical protein
VNRRILILASLALMGGCVPTPRPVVTAAGAPLAELEPLYAARAGREALTITVASNGCTRKDDFAVYVERQGESATVSFGRKRVDGCRSLAIGRADIAFTYAELGVAGRTPLFLLNPLTAWVGPGD